MKDKRQKNKHIGFFNVVFGSLLLIFLDPLDIYSMDKNEQNPLFNLDISLVKSSISPVQSSNGRTDNEFTNHFVNESLELDLSQQYVLGDSFGAKDSDQEFADLTNILNSVCNRRLDSSSSEVSSLTEEEYGLVQKKNKPVVNVEQEAKFKQQSGYDHQIIDVCKNLSNILHHTFDQLDLNLLVSSGDDNLLKNQVFIEGFLSNTNNGANFDTKTTIFGGSFGYLRNLDDTKVLGVAFTNLNGLIDYQSDGSQARLKAYIGSIYARVLYQNIKFNISTFFGVNNTIKHQQNDHSSDSGNIYAINTSTSYKINLGNHLMEPGFGMAYASNSSKNSKGHDLHLYAISAKAYLQYGYIIQNDEMLILPTISVGFIGDLVSNAGKKVVIGHSDESSYLNINRHRQVLFIKPSITSKGDWSHLSISYCLEMGKDFTSHQGFVKFMINL